MIVSFNKTRKVLLFQFDDFLVAKMVAASLRAEHQNDPALVRKIHADTNIKLHTVEKWIYGVNSPKSGHLLKLASLYPEVLKAILETIGRGDVWELCVREKIPNTMREQLIRKKPRNAVYRDKNVPINILIETETATKLNKRQLWFLSELQKNKKRCAQDIAGKWQVDVKTARRDIAGLVALGIIRFDGARKNGFYLLC